MAGDTLRDNLQEGVHYTLVTQGTWGTLHGWYGGGPAICRTAVLDGLAQSSKKARVTLYPMKLEVWYSEQRDHPKYVEVDKSVSGKGGWRHSQRPCQHVRVCHVVSRDSCEQWPCSS